MVGSERIETVEKAVENNGPLCLPIVTREREEWRHELDIGDPMRRSFHITSAGEELLFPAPLPRSSRVISRRDISAFWPYPLRTAGRSTGSGRNHRDGAGCRIDEDVDAAARRRAGHEVVHPPWTEWIRRSRHERVEVARPAHHAVELKPGDSRGDHHRAPRRDERRAGRGQPWIPPWAKPDDTAGVVDYGGVGAGWVPAHPGVR